MPCYSPPMHKDEFGHWKDGEIPQEHFDKLVRLLREANKIIDAHMVDYHSDVRRSRELSDWWKGHK